MTRRDEKMKKTAMMGIRRKSKVGGIKSYCYCTFIRFTCKKFFVIVYSVSIKICKI